MKRLFIAEKPELAKAIVDGLDGGQRCDTYYQCGDDVVTWCIGHLLELCEPADFDQKYEKWCLEDLPIKTPIKYKPKANTKKQFDAVVRLIKEAETIVHAGDNDAEGQLIVDELLDYVGNRKPVLRFLTNDNNTKIVKRALANMKDNSEYRSLYHAALARNVGDQWYGFNLSRAYTVQAQNKGFQGVLPVGRVQTPILGLVRLRELANEGHEKQIYYDVIGQFAIDTLTFPAKYMPGDNAPTDDKNRLIDNAFANNVVTETTGQPATVSVCDTVIKESSPPLPYNMLKLQADASKRYNYKPDKVMEITQELREKYRLITYNGSDCQYLNEEQHGDAPNVLAAIKKTATGFLDIVDDADSTIKSRAFNNANVTAHHAIIPTEATAKLDSLSEPLRHIYLMIAERYVAQFYPKHRYRATALTLDVNSHAFKTHSNITIDPGWTILFDTEKASDAEDDNTNTQSDLSVLTHSSTGHCTTADVQQKETKPPALYTMATLLEDLTRVAKYVTDPKIKQLLIEKDKDKKEEHGGIGTSRTRDRIIKGLFDRQLLTEKGKKIITTDLGKQFYDALPRIATSPDMTALWHEEQQLIESGEYSYEAFLDGLIGTIEEQIDNVKTNQFDLKIAAYECPGCKEGILKQRKGNFWGCSRYPDCKTTLPNKAGKPDYKALETQPCPACEAPLKRIKGKYGFFWPCNACKINFNDKRGKPVPKDQPDVTEFLCAACDSPLIKRTSKKRPAKGKQPAQWFDCSAFPTCKQRYWARDGQPQYEESSAVS